MSLIGLKIDTSSRFDQWVGSSQGVHVLKSMIKGWVGEWGFTQGKV